MKDYLTKNNYVKADIACAQKVMLEILKEVDRICNIYKIKYFLSDGTLLGAVRHQGFIPWDDDLDISMLRKDYDKFKEIAPKELSRKFFFQTSATDKYYDIYHIPLKIRDNNSLIIEQKGKKYHQGLYIDIFPIDKVPERKIKANIQKFLGNLWTLKLPMDAKDFPKPKFFVRSAMQIIGFMIPAKLISKLQLSTIRWNEESKGDIYSYGVELTWKTLYKKQDLFPLKKIKFQGEYFWVPNNPHNILTNIYGDYMTLPPVEERRVHGLEMYVKIQ